MDAPRSASAEGQSLSNELGRYGDFLACILNGLVRVFGEAAAGSVVFPDKDDSEGAFLEHAGEGA